MLHSHPGAIVKHKKNQSYYHLNLKKAPPDIHIWNPKQGMVVWDDKT